MPAVYRINEYELAQIIAMGFACPDAHASLFKENQVEPDDKQLQAAQADRGNCREKMPKDSRRHLARKGADCMNTAALYPGENMETIVIQSKHRPASDSALSRLLALAKDNDDAENLTMWFGIENEAGEVYRIIGVDGIADYVRTLKQLRDAGYWIESLEAEVPGALHALVKARGEAQAL